MRTRIALALLISLAATGCNSTAAPDEPVSAPVSQPAEDPVGFDSVTLPEGSGVRPAPNVTAS
ncbi:MAG: hypothetical protein ACJA2F_001496, partial [Nitriliruptoraceae bacterium]